MFKRVLLCYDGSVVSRRALRRGAELAILLRSEVHVLSVSSGNDPAVVAGALGHACLVTEQNGARQVLQDGIDWLKEHGVVAHGYLASGDTYAEIVAHSRRLQADLIVLGHYPRPAGGYWWSNSQRSSLAESTKCCVLVAVDPAHEPSRQITA